MEDEKHGEAYAFARMRESRTEEAKKSWICGCRLIIAWRGSGVFALLRLIGYGLPFFLLGIAVLFLVRSLAGGNTHETGWSG